MLSASESDEDLSFAEFGSTTPESTLATTIRSRQYVRRQFHLVPLVDSATYSSLATLFSLASNFLTSRSGSRESATAAEFRDWLKTEMFPQLLGQSEQALHSIVTLKAANNEQFGRMLKMLEDIHAAVVEAAPAGVWSTLSDREQRILQYMDNVCRDDPYSNASDDSVIDHLGEDPSLLDRDSRHLDQLGLLKVVSYTGGRTLRPTPEGICLSWASTDPENYQTSVAQVLGVLPAYPHSKRLQQVVAETALPLGRAFFLLERWDSGGHLTFSDNAGDPIQARISDVSEELLRTGVDPFR